MAERRGEETFTEWAAAAESQAAMLHLRQNPADARVRRRQATLDEAGRPVDPDERADP